MKKIMLFICFSLVFIKTKAQPPSTGCNQATTSINTIFYPNTITNITSTATSISGMFLCGPNTIVYDTSNISQSGFVCRTAFVNSTSTLVTNSYGCAYYEVFFVKANATIIFPSNTNNVGINVYYEPGAIIIDNSAGVNTFSCSSLVFPSVNCSAMGIDEHNLNEVFKIYPNPVQDLLQIQITGNIENQFTKIEILNSLGQIVREEILRPTQQSSGEKTYTIKTNELADGVYLLNLKNDKSENVSKRFVISR